jgi:hypothetical protein
MSDAQQDDTGPIIAWEFFRPLPDTVRREEDLQGALRGDIALFEEAAKKTTTWMGRRQVAFETGRKALSKLSTCKDPVSAVATWARWLCGSINRIAADLSDAQDFGVKAAAVGAAMVEGFSASGRAPRV